MCCGAEVSHLPSAINASDDDLPAPVLTLVLKRLGLSPPNVQLHLPRGSGESAKMGIVRPGGLD